MMNVPCMAHAAKPARTPTGHTDAAAQKDTSYSLTGDPAKPNKVSGTLASWNNEICIAWPFSFLIIPVSTAVDSWLIIAMALAVIAGRRLMRFSSDRIYHTYGNG